MGAEHERECFNNPLILYSEHKRVLETAIKNCDARLKDAERRGYYRGAADTLLLTVVLCVMAAIVGMEFGLSLADVPNNDICVPLYDNTGYERCQ